MTFRRFRTRNLQTLTSEVFLSVRVDEDLKVLLTGVKQVCHGKDPPIISLPDEDMKRNKGLRPFRSPSEWSRSQEEGEDTPQRLLLVPVNGGVWVV